MYNKLKHEIQYIAAKANESRIISTSYTVSSDTETYKKYANKIL